jgi:hypothetical protein
VTFRFLILALAMIISSRADAGWKSCFRWILPAEAPVTAPPVVESNPALESLLAIGIEAPSAKKLIEALGSSEAVGKLMSKVNEPLTFERIDSNNIKLSVNRAEALSVLGRILISLSAVRGRMEQLDIEWISAAQLITSENGSTGSIYLEGANHRLVVVAEHERVDFYIGNPGRLQVDTGTLQKLKINGTVVEKP